MAYNHEYPYFDSGQFNVDWLLNEIKEIEEELSGTKTYDYKGENEVLDLNDLRPNSMASFTENFNVLNAPVSGVRRFVFTNGSMTGGLQRCYDLKTMEVYARNFTITNSGVIWASWTKTQLKAGTIMNSVRFITNTSLDDNKPNTVTWVQGGNGSVTNAPTGYNGFVLDWKSEGASPRIQVWFDMMTKFIYIRTLSGSSWTVWQEANHIDFTGYYKAMSTQIDDLNDLKSPGSSFANMAQVLNGPVNSGFYQVFSIGARGGILYQIAYDLDIPANIYVRRLYSSNWGEWKPLLLQPSLLHRITATNANNIVGGSYYSGAVTNNQPSQYSAILTIGADKTSDQYQLSWSNTARLFCRFYSSRSGWGAWSEFQKVSSRQALIASSLPTSTSTDDEGKERTMIEENLYSETAKTSSHQYLNCPGQSLYHSDPDAQSYSEAIRAREDLTTFDTVITNLEQWDMDIPLTELVEKTREFVQGIKEGHPLADIVILSVPPVDVPFSGEELYSYTWPSGNTLTEVDDALTALAGEAGFSYITWKDYKHIDNTNLMSCYDNLYKEPVYKRSLESYVSRQVKNCIE